MCELNKCCYCVKLDLGCILIGIVSFIFSITMTILSTVYLTEDLGNVGDLHARDNGTLKYIVQVKMIENFEIPLPTLHIILCSSLVLGIMLMMASISLLVGLKLDCAGFITMFFLLRKSVEAFKRRPGFILFYFGFGIFFVIFSQLGGLLMLLQKKWEFPMVVFIISVLYIHFLVVVHTVYEETLRSVHLYGSKSVERLVEEDSISTITVEASDIPPLVAREVTI